MFKRFRRNVGKEVEGREKERWPQLKSAAEFLGAYVDKLDAAEEENGEVDGDAADYDALELD